MEEVGVPELSLRGKVAAGFGARRGIFSWEAANRRNHDVLKRIGGPCLRQ